MDIHTKKLYFKQEEAAESGPSVNSPDIEQRIAARRIRIQKRLAQKAPTDPETESECKKDEMSLSRKQIELSNARIAKLVRDGDLFITNVRVACDAREHLRRTEEDELNAKRIEKLEDDAINKKAVFDEITEKWDSIRTLELPQEMRDMLTAQKNRCTELVGEKNKLINELNLELKAKDDHYVRELKKRTEDIDLLTERMESQIQAMQKTYKEELVAIDNALVAQKDKLMAEQKSEWEQLMMEVKRKQENYLEQHRVTVEEFDKELEELRTKHSEEYNALKISLESEVETLESQLLQLKATYQLNLEKLEYNFQVLKRRDEENMFTKSNQKRKITRMLDTLNNLHVRANRQEKQYSNENEQLSEDYKKRMENFRDLQKKSKLLIEAEHRNFHDIWVMNEEALKKLANRLLEAHRVINEQQLGIPWIRPDTSFMSNVGPLAGPVELISKKPPAVIAIQQAFRTESSPLSANGQRGPNAIPTSLRDVSPEVVRDFLHLLCYEPEFLIEEKLKRLLKPLSREEEMLMRLDTILTAIGVTNEEELDYLFTHFIVPTENSPLTEQPQRPTKVIRRIELTHPQTAAEQESVNTETQLILSREVVDPESQFYSEEERGTTFASTDAAVAVDVLDDDDDANERKVALGELDENTSKHISARTGRTSDITGDPLDSKPVSLWCQPKDEEAQPASISDMTEATAFPVDEDKEKKAWSLISPANVVNTLNQFMENMQRREVAHCAAALKSKRNESEIEGLKRSQVDNRVSLYGSKPFDSSADFRDLSSGGVEPEKRDDSHDTEYWQKYATRIVSSETEKVWDNLCVGLERYLRILKHRAKLIHESEILKRQNAELRHLLQEYLKAPVNNDLKLPPATTMKLE